MALDATLGGEDANSYCDVAFADAYAATRQWGPDWLALADEEKELALIGATMWMETLNWTGTRCSATQALAWPRQGATCDGVTSDCSAIPTRIKQAECELAMKFAKDPNPISGGGGGTNQAGVFVSVQQLGDLRQEFTEYSNPQSSSCDSCGDPALIQKYPWIKDFLGCWYGGGGITAGGSGLILRVRS